MRRAVAALAVVATACAGSTGEPSTSTTTSPTTTVAPATTVTVATTTTTAAAPTTTAVRFDGLAVPQLFTDALVAADRAGLEDLLAPGATWILAGAGIEVAAPLPPDFAEFAIEFGLSPDATFLDLVMHLREQRATIAPRITLTECVEGPGTVACGYREEDALSLLTGSEEVGRIELHLDDQGRITEVWLDTVLRTAAPDPDRDAFFRWSAIEEPEISNRPTAAEPLSPSRATASATNSAISCTNRSATCCA